MAKTPSSTKSESVTLRIPNEIFSQILNYAADNTKGNRSEAIVELIEAGLSVQRQQPTQNGITVQDIARQKELSETVSALAERVDQLTSLVQDSVLQRITAGEAELVGK